MVLIVMFLENKNFLQVFFIQISESALCRLADKLCPLCLAHGLELLRCRAILTCSDAEPIVELDYDIFTPLLLCPQYLLLLDVHFWKVSDMFLNFFGSLPVVFYLIVSLNG